LLSGRGGKLTINGKAYTFSDISISHKGEA